MLLDQLVRSPNGLGERADVRRQEGRASQRGSDATNHGARCARRHVGYTTRRKRALVAALGPRVKRSEEHTSELQSLAYLVCRLLLEKKKKTMKYNSVMRLKV